MSMHSSAPPRFHATCLGGPNEKFLGHGTIGLGPERSTWCEVNEAKDRATAAETEIEGATER